MKIVKSCLTVLVMTSSVMAIEPIQKEAGWSGYILLGAGHMKYENSEVSGNKVLDLEHRAITDRGSASEESTVMPVISGLVRYTLEDKKTEFFAGNSLEDYLRMDFTMTLGVRHDFQGIGILGLRVLSSTTPTDVWEDPLLTQAERESTERTSLGIGLKWERIMGTGFELDVRARNIKFDTDRNGESLVDNALAGTAHPDGGYYITNAQQELLQREGTLASVELLYSWKINKSNQLVPAIRLLKNDRDGDARDHTQSELKLTHAYFNKKWLIATSIYVESSAYDEKNPVFDKKQDTVNVGGGVNVTYRKPFGWEDWAVNGGFYATKGDSDIDFYDTSLRMATLGMIYSF